LWRSPAYSTLKATRRPADQLVVVGAVDGGSVEEDGAAPPEWRFTKP
jgi:hypothetical protein